MQRNSDVSKRVKYLIRTLAIIEGDGQCHNYGLSYLEATKEGEYFHNLVITRFEREQPGTCYLERLKMIEESGGIFRIVPN